MKMYLLAFLNQFPSLKAFLRIVLLRAHPASVSTNYVQLRDAEAGSESSRLRNAWKATELPRKQRRLVETQLDAYRRGEPVDVFDVMVQAMRALPDGAWGLTVLEVGCSSGYYSEVFNFKGLGVTYAGCDYSDAFIALARQSYSSLRFDVEDATALSYGKDAFDVVISGCCLLHIPEYEAAIAETARVTRQYAIFHRTPMVLGQPNTYYRKQAYGVETVEIHFNELEFLAMLKHQGLELLRTWTLSQEGDAVRGSAVRTYLCRKVPI